MIFILTLLIKVAVVTIILAIAYCKGYTEGFHRTNVHVNDCIYFLEEEHKGSTPSRVNSRALRNDRRLGIRVF